MLFWCYWLIVLFVSLGLLLELWREGNWREQATAGLVLLPLLLRLFLIK